jgi:8-oxo-dGTP pyrophosphatase MutT (NUDIX family)
MTMQEANLSTCAGGIVLGDKGTIALVRNRKDTKWFFPKGHIDEGEDLEEAARREIEEETGLTDLEYIDTLPSYTRPGIDKNSHYTNELKEIHMFLFAAPMHAELSPSLEIVDAAWISLSRLALELEDTKDSVWFSSVFERVRQAVQRD